MKFSSEEPMDDLIWYIAVSALFICLGIVFARIGLAIWKKQKMELIIRHHCSRVKAENKKAYCVLTGTGVFTIGIGFVLSGICSAFLQSAAVFIPMSAGLAAGIALLILAGKRYNH